MLKNSGFIFLQAEINILVRLIPVGAGTNIHHQWHLQPGSLRHALGHRAPQTLAILTGHLEHQFVVHLHQHAGPGPLVPPPRLPGREPQGEAGGTGARRHRRSRHRGDQIPLARAVAGIDDHRQVRRTLEELRALGPLRWNQTVLGENGDGQIQQVAEEVSA